MKTVGENSALKESHSREEPDDKAAQNRVSTDRPEVEKQRKVGSGACFLGGHGACCLYGGVWEGPTLGDL